MADFVGIYQQRDHLSASAEVSWVGAGFERERRWVELPLGIRLPIGSQGLRWMRTTAWWAGWNGADPGLLFTVAALPGDCEWGPFR